jgi:hypothetical protein
MAKKYISIVVLCLFFGIATLQAQHRQKPKISFKDSLDGAFDMSDYLIYANGFITVPTIITEPALGGIGGAIVPVFIKKREPVVDSLTGRKRIIRPDITGGIALYTANNSWLTAAFRSGTFAKAHIMYRVAAGYGSLNINLYETLPVVGEQEYEFHFNVIPVYLQALKQFRNEHWSLGPQYLFLQTTLSLPGAELPDFVKKDEIKTITSQLGLALQFDNRDNIFTPDKGIRWQSDFFWSDSVLGSDYDAWRVNYSAIGYTPITEKLIGGLRIEGVETFGDLPFYMQPSINLRGIPGGRYQANNTLQLEGELRWDVYRRWSAVFFGGAGQAFDKWDEMFDSSLKATYGTGFRYLIARKFKLRMGVDVAKGPEDWAYYIVFGSNWMR